MSNLRQFQSILSFRSAYSSASKYYPSDVVTYLNESYVCISAGIQDILPTVSGGWTKMADNSLSASTTGAGTTPSSYTLTISGSTIYLNKPS